MDWILWKIQKNGAQQDAGKTEIIKIAIPQVTVVAV